MMVTDAKLREIVRRVEAFVEITNERMDDTVLVDLLTHITNLRLDADKVWDEVRVYQRDVDEHMAENLKFREAMMVQFEGL